MFGQSDFFVYFCARKMFTSVNTFKINVFIMVNTFVQKVFIKNNKKIVKMI